MAKTNFSVEENQIKNLTLDLARGNYSMHIDSDKVTKKDLENYLRDKINNDILQGRTLYQAFRKNNIVLFEIVEEVVNLGISENVFDSPFMNTFVEIKNRYLGDETKFYSEGGLLTVARFAGNHWDTNRQFIDVGNEVTLPREWIYIHVYEDLERFLLGVSNLEKIMDKIYKSMNKYIQDRLYTMFKTVKNAVPTEFAKTGNNAEALGSLINLVEAAGGYNEMIIAGTKAAIRKIIGYVPDKAFADTQKEAVALTGSLGMYEGSKVIVIPQTLKSSTFELALADNEIFVIGGDSKPIKLEYVGDARSDIDTEGKKNNDQSVDIQVQTLIGLGMVLPQYFGHFTLT